MANVIIDNSNLTDIANAIRDKNGSATTYKPREMASAIEAIQTYKPEETFNVTPTTSAQTVTPSTGHVFSGGTVQAMPTGSISVNTPTINTSTGVVTASTTLNTAGYIGTNPSSKTLSLSTQAATTITPTTSEQTAVAANKYTTGAVKVAAMPTGAVGTATATKGTVSNNSISVTPNVAAGTAGYNAHTAYSGTAVTVSASELVSGTVTTTPKVISQNVDVTNYATSTVGPIYEEISTSAAMDAVNVDANVGKMYKYTGTTDTKYTNGRLYTCETLVMPTKGQLINMNLGNTRIAGQNNLYRVLSVSGTTAEVLAMYDYTTSAYNSSGTNTYSGAQLDTILNTTFYNSLTTAAKAAIVQKNITCYEYDIADKSQYDPDTHASWADYSTKATHESVGNRYVYALDVEDIENYFNNVFSTANIWTLFWNTTTAPSNTNTIWTRSTTLDSTMMVYGVLYHNGNIAGYNYVTSTYIVRPAFCIDLSKIKWSYEE